MRITNSLQYHTLQSNIETGLDNLNTVQGQISTGKKLTTFADDPAGASQSLALRSAEGDNTQYQRDADHAKSLLTAGDSALGNANTLVQSARQIAVEGANSDQSAASFAALSDQVNGIITQLTQVANTDVAGKYIFGGTNTTTPPFDATQTYQGNSAAITATVGPNNHIALNQPGDAAFSPAFTALKTLQTDLSAGNVSAISNDIGQIDTSLSTFSAAQATIGAKTDTVTAVQSNLQRAQISYQDSVSNIEDVDLATAYVQLQSAQNVYQASLATTAKAFQYSLADFLH